jgi:acyl carrier protein
MGWEKTMNRDEIFQGVKECLAECIRINPDTVKLESTIINDLEADSLDLLDLVFSLERRFKIKIRQGDIERKAREGIAAEEFENNNQLLPKGVERMRMILSEVPPERIKEGMSLSNIPYLFTVETFVKIIEQSTEQNAE